MNDEELIRRYAASGDVAAFRALVQRHRPFLRRLLGAALGADREDMADAEQEVLIALSTALPRFRFGSSFPTFLYRIARNTAVDLIRLRRRERSFLFEAPPGSAADEGSDPAAAAERNWRRERLRAAMGELEPADRMLVTLRDAEDVPVRDLARIAGIPEGTVKSRLHRARRKLARSLGGADHV